MAEQNSDYGKEGEELACGYLTEKGYRIIARNYRYGHGEIDIIAEDGDILVFVEVKTRTNLNFGRPEYAVTPAKQRQIRKLAEAYLYDKKIVNRDCRLDVVAVLMPDRNNPEINHIINAF